MKMTFSRIGAVGKGLLRNENVSLPHLKGKVVLGRVAAVDDNGFYRVETGFKTCVFSPMIPREPLPKYDKYILFGNCNVSLGWNNI